MNCQDLKLKLHFLGDLPEAERAGAHRHADGCPDCRHRLLEVQHLDDLLLGWTAPAVPADLADRVVARLQEQPDGTGCEAVLARVHDLAADELEPWRRESIQQHLSLCHTCQEGLEEARRLRAAWQRWTAPDAPADLDRRVVSALRERTAASRPLPELAWWRRGSGARRVAAALLLVAGLLTIANLWQMFSTPEPAPVSAPVAMPPSVSPEIDTLPVRMEPSYQTLHMYGNEPGQFDVSGSFGARYLPTRGRLLRQVDER